MDTKILVGNFEGNRPLGRPRSRLENIIKIDIREKEWEVVDCINLAQDRGSGRTFVNTVIYLRVT
jgi:hypothetical protein